MTSSKKPGSDDKLFDKSAAGRRTTSEITPALEYWATTLRLMRKHKRLLREKAALLIQLEQLAAKADAGFQAVYSRPRTNR